MAKNNKVESTRRTVVPAKAGWKVTETAAGAFKGGKHGVAGGKDTIAAPPKSAGTAKHTIATVKKDLLVPASEVKVVRVGEFRNNMATFLSEAKTRKIKIQSPSAGDFYIVPASELEYVSYDPNFVEKINRANEEFESTGGTVVNVDELWK